MKEFYPEGWLYNSTDNRKNMITPSAIVQSKELCEVLESNVVMCDAEHNLTVDLGCMTGIIPRNEGAIGIDDGRTRDIALISRVGKPVCFVVTDVKTDSKGRLYAVLSRKTAQEQALSDFKSKHKVGDIIDAKVTHLETFGAFCDIGCGNIALLPIDSISVSRISHSSDRFRVGDNIKAVIKSMESDGRITLSHKELLGNWEENAEMFSQGQTVSGVVRSVEDYGIFVELTPNLAGLAESKTGVRVGQTASVYIKSIIPEKMKIKLIIIDSFDAEYRSSFRYFYQGDHIDNFVYSPKDCERVVETVF